jgi:hypothetical protein
MIKIFEREIPNRMDELTIEQFEKVTEITNNQELDNIDRYIKIFEYFGVKESEWDENEVELNDFIEKVKEFNSSKYEKKDAVESIELDGYTYHGQLKLSVKDTKMIEKLIGRKSNNWISDLLALMFKRSDLSPTEHYAEAHLKHKSKLFKQLKAEIAIPYLVFVTEKIASHAQSQPSEAVEPSND